MAVLALDTFKPPSGVQARRVVMAFTALVALGRAGLTLITSPGSAARINVVPQSQYAIVFWRFSWHCSGRGKKGD